MKSRVKCTAYLRAVFSYGGEILYWEKPVLAAVKFQK